MAAGDITDALVDELSLIMEDSEEKRFTEATKLIFLNKAQRQLCNLLHNGYLTEFEDVALTQSLSSQALALSSLNSGNGVLRGGAGILRVKVYIGGVGDGVWATEIDLMEVKKLENQYLAHSDAAPRYFIFDSKINVKVTTYTDTTIDVYFLKMPAVMTTDVDPEVNESLHGIMLTLAEARLWGMDSKIDRKNAALTQALQEIEILNGRYRKAEGIGTINREVAEGQ